MGLFALAGKPPGLVADPLPDRYSLLHAVHRSRTTETPRSPPVGDGWTHEVKFDGWRIQLHKDGNVARLYTKNGYDCTTRLEGLASALAAVPSRSCIIDGEVTVAYNSSDEVREFVEKHPIRPGRHSAAGRAALERRTIHIPDWRTDSEYSYGAPVINQPAGPCSASRSSRATTCSASCRSIGWKSSGR
jgi:hypothetical protein